MTTARNDVTGDLIISKNNNKNFDNNFESIFGAKKSKGGSWVYDPETRSFIEKPRPKENKSAAVRMDIEPFVSPIDGSIINTRSQLDQHNARNNVSNDLDSLREKTDQCMNRSHTTGTSEERKKDMLKQYEILEHNPHLRSEENG